ncbi:uncharacterized protein LOC135698791 [Ochlerotatus camptorhynchus]|uniref:uncharacterized protein LOC135698791 n=1 Tax=Ochlerotatus camptorhynchus TaxID=644619 RepID=UPI0031E291B5
MAVSRLRGLEKRLAKDPELRRTVNEQIESYEQKQYVCKVSSEELENTKMVWDAAAAKAGGVSFNDKLLKGPNLLVSLVEVLLRFREGKIAVCSDIREMFLRILIREADKWSQCFLWRSSPEDEVQVYVINVAMFGATSSPCTVQFVKNKNALDYAELYPRAVNAIINNHYVDDFLDSVNSVEEAVQLVEQVQLIHAAAGFKFGKILSNSQDVLERLGETGSSACKSLNLDRDEVYERVLGVIVHFIFEQGEELALGSHSLNHENLWGALRRKRVPDKFVNLIEAYQYQAFTCRVLHNEALSDPIRVLGGVRQECILSPLLFLIVIDEIMIQNPSIREGLLLDLQYVILGTLGNDPVVLYGHLDVQPAIREDGWDTEPFVLTEKDGKLYGWGACDDKGPVLGWIHVIEAYQAIGEPLPVNLKFVFEGMDESGRKGLDALLFKRQNDFLFNVDFVCISNNYWLGTTKPCITYGLRSICYFDVEVGCAGKDLHSEVFGGTVYEAMNDLVYLLGTLADKEGKILIPNLYKEVAPLHGVEGVFYEPGQKTVIPKKVIPKCSIHIVSDQTPELVEKFACEQRPLLVIVVCHGSNSHCVTKRSVSDSRLMRRRVSRECHDILHHCLTIKWAERGSPNKCAVRMTHSGNPWTEDPNHPHYNAASVSTKHVYKVEPDMTREGGSIPVTLTLQQTTGKNVLLLPMGASDDGAHSQNEKIDVRNYIEGTKLLGAYLYEVAKIK